MTLRVTASGPIRTVLRAAMGICALAAACLMVNGCASTPPLTPPPPEPEPVLPEAAPPAPPPPAYVRVTGSRLNVREAPTTSARTVTKVARGARLAKRGEQGEWLEVELADGSRGWVHGKYVSAEPECPADTVEPVILSEPVVGFVEGTRHGRIELEGTVSKSGEVVAVKVQVNSTGSPELEVLATDELLRMRFAPFVRNCRPVPFIYVYARSF
jgi:uncharacterized protein YgiM (DUF1202 family)